ncbi:RNA polymerase sigma factor [Flavicella sediminum]|uniref:RNA polymerase sigma factor n=1 Tax=Flavicella sediminum TaxID=2585141 RepID=UPI0011246031|nr:sigma-70 family RNA polymerase sigma factor [Flavicella sediminum]
MEESVFDNLCEEKQFDAFYKKQVNHAFRFIVAKNKDKDEAFDVVQEAFIKIWENCNKFDLSKAKAYLLSTARNIFYNMKKHEKVVRAYEQAAPDDLYTSNDTPEGALQEKEFKQKLEETINKLPDIQKEVFLLNRMEGKKYREIAELLDISVKAVEKRMSKALLTLRSEMEGLENI